MTIVLGLAAYNEESSIDPLFNRLMQLEESLGRLPVIFYDDGSQDSTAGKVAAWRNHLQINLMQGSENRGLAFGIARIVETFVEQYQPEDSLVLMDSDDTHDPAQILQMLNCPGGRPVVIASRYQPGSRIDGLSRFRTLASIVFSTIARGYLRVSGVRDYTSGFRLYPYPVLAQVLDDGLWQTDREFGFAVTPELLIRCAATGTDFAEIPMILSYDRKTSASNMRVAHNAKNLIRLLPQWRQLVRSGRPRNL